MYFWYYINMCIQKNKLQTQKLRVLMKLLCISRCTCVRACGYMLYEYVWCFRTASGSASAGASPSSSRASSSPQCWRHSTARRRRPTSTTRKPTAARTSRTRKFVTSSRRSLPITSSDCTTNVPYHTACALLIIFIVILYAKLTVKDVFITL